MAGRTFLPARRSLVTIPPRTHYHVGSGHALCSWFTSRRQLGEEGYTISSFSHFELSLPLTVVRKSLALDGPCCFFPTLSLTAVCPRPHGDNGRFRAYEFAWPTQTAEQFVSLCGGMQYFPSTRGAWHKISLVGARVGEALCPLKRLGGGKSYSDDHSSPPPEITFTFRKQM